MRAFKGATPLPPGKKIAVYFWITLCTLLFYVFLAKLTPQRVGDGSEYYALFIAWKETFRPWMTEASYRVYQDLFLQHSIVGLVPRDWFPQAFPALTYRGEADFNHFWLYSFLAFSVARISQFLGLVLQPHSAFLGLHFVLVTMSASIAYYLYGRRGILAFVLMTLFSPMLWFSDKVHTELMTYCLTLAGVMLVYSRKYTMAAFFIALASTQNPSFALIAFVPFVFRFYIERNKKFSAVEVITITATALLVLAHPVYYFLRFGVPTPQLLAGGASLGGNLSIFYIWILDPDLGLLPNWPLGVFLILFAIGLKTLKKTEAAPLNNTYFYLFVAIFLAVNFYAHSSTMNLNSGATPGLARYSLWYLPLFFPIVYYVTCNFPSRKALGYPAAAIVMLIGCTSLYANNPKRPESYSTPTPLSNAIQAKLPWLYTPPTEVFAERFSGLGEAISQYPVRGVLGPDCRKLLLLPGEAKSIITVPAHCQMDAKKLGALINERTAPLVETFIRLDDIQQSQALLTLNPMTYEIGLSGSGNFALASGWYSPEAWGVWSRKETASLSIPCNSQQYYAKKEKLELILSLRGFGEKRVSMEQNNSIIFQGLISAQQDIPLTVTTNSCNSNSITININIENPTSPAELGQSDDSRKLGVGLSSFTLKN